MTANVAHPRANPHDITLPHFKSTPNILSEKDGPSPTQIAQKWLASFSSAIASADTTRLSSLIHEDGWWRDHLALTWDFRTIRGLSKIVDFLTPLLSKARLENFKARETGKFAPHKEWPIPELEWIEFMFEFSNAVGEGKGMIRLASSPETGVWKAHMIYTALQTLKDFPEQIGDLRPHGGTNSLEGGARKGN